MSFVGAGILWRSRRAFPWRKPWAWAIATAFGFIFAAGSMVLTLVVTLVTMFLIGLSIHFFYCSFSASASVPEARIF